MIIDIMNCFYEINLIGYFFSTLKLSLSMSNVVQDQCEKLHKWKIKFFLSLLIEIQTIFCSQNFYKWIEWSKWMWENKYQYGEDDCL